MRSFLAFASLLHAGLAVEAFAVLPDFASFADAFLGGFLGSWLLGGLLGDLLGCWLLDDLLGDFLSGDFLGYNIEDKVRLSPQAPIESEVAAALARYNGMITYHTFEFCFCL